MVRVECLLNVAGCGLRGSAILERAREVGARDDEDRAAEIRVEEEEKLRTEVSYLRTENEDLRKRKREVEEELEVVKRANEGLRTEYENLRKRKGDADATILEQGIKIAKLEEKQHELDESLADDDEDAAKISKLKAKVKHWKHWPVLGQILIFALMLINHNPNPTL